jgi:ABC-type transport system involved in multi-copper enzyme maturation permease subunit
MFSAVGSDLPGFSLRRTLAIAWLAVQESLRKRVLMAVMALFIVILLFAGWFLDPSADNPGKLYLSFVLSTSNLLVLFMSVFLATLSLPNDMKNRTIYTVVTKPVRPSEIVLGRVLGFAAVGTVLLTVMAVLSFVFVTRGLAHSHTVDEDSVKEVRSSSTKELTGYEGSTSYAGGHEHEFRWDDERKFGATDMKQGHNHEVTRNADGSFSVGKPQGQLQARVPVYGELRWLDREGKPDENQRGISVGHEWDYRHYIAGGTKAAVIWTFSGITPDRFKPDADGNCIQLETTIRIFRTYKGDIEKGVLGSITLRNPNPAKNKQSAPMLHRFKEFEVDTLKLPEKVARLPSELERGRDVKVVEPYNLFEDLVEDGKLEVILRCEEPAQYYGVAQPDVYIRAANRPFWLNFFKCFVTIWLEMIVVVSFGVMFSTFLSGPIAFVGTIATLIVGFFIAFIREIVYGMFSSPDDPMAYKGGGPIESIIRIMTQQNIQTELEVGATTDLIVKTIDKGFAVMLYATTYVVPGFGDYDTVRQVAYGFNIDATILSQLCLITLGYTIGTTLVAYFVLKTREIASDT